MSAREQYIEELKNYLTPLSSDDRQSAIEFYDEYIADAGFTTISAIVDKLGTPEQLSSEIIAKTTGTEPNSSLNPDNDKRLKKILLICLVVVLLIIFIPIIIELIGLAIAAIAATVGFGIASFGMAIPIFATDAWGGIFYLGGGIALIGILIILIAIIAWAAKWCIRGCKNLIQYLKTKFKEVA
ncbi:HAAS signaling domain-containing protein [Limosilactobacillus viscerum]|uniref:HAAS signaling domain-containing protein n=1 Tax=Limosilactobacillus viscerum TaxID=2993450 RepID=UPI0024BB6633|nr:DUF1700 domain-containing protein [Limosilactobacillus viscerum]